MSSKHKTRTFRPWPENMKRLELAEQIGLNVSELLNEAVDTTFDTLLKKKSAKIQQALLQVPA